MLPPPVAVRARVRARACPTAAPASAAQFTYDEPLRVESLTQSICDLKMSFGEGGDDDDDEDGGDGGGGSRRKAKMSRPFGVSLLVAGCDARGPQLYCTDPSGTYVCWDAQAIGNGSEAARTILQERYAKTLSVDAAAVLIVRVLCETMEEKVRPRRGAAAHAEWLRLSAAARATQTAAARPRSPRNSPLPPPSAADHVGQHRAGVGHARARLPHVHARAARRRHRQGAGGDGRRGRAVSARRGEMAAYYASHSRTHARKKQQHALTHPALSLWQLTKDDKDLPV